MGENMTTVKSLIEMLQRNHYPDEVIAAQIWHTEDVLDQAKNRDPVVKLTKADAEQILEDLDRHQDASLGISWDTLDCHIDEFLREQKPKEKS